MYMTDSCNNYTVIGCDNQAARESLERNCGGSNDDCQMVALTSLPFEAGPDPWSQVSRTAHPAGHSSTDQPQRYEALWIVRMKS